MLPLLQTAVLLTSILYRIWDSCTTGIWRTSMGTSGRRSGWICRQCRLSKADCIAANITGHRHARWLIFCEGNDDEMDWCRRLRDDCFSAVVQHLCQADGITPGTPG